MQPAHVAASVHSERTSPETMNGINVVSECTNCSLGRWSDETGRVSDNQCLGFCSRGRYGSHTGATADSDCTKCPDGKNTEALGAIKCETPIATCDAGAYSINGNCSDCPSGSFGQSASGKSTTCTECGFGQYASEKKLTECKPCPRNMVTGVVKNASVCVPCKGGAIRDVARIVCTQCAVSEYALADGSACSACGGNGMDCSGGVLKLVPGWWYDMDAATTLGGKRRRLTNSAALVNITGDLSGGTPMFKCLNPKSCKVLKNTIVQCADHATGALCAVCESGYVPDDAATDGRCKECDSTPAERWISKVAMLCAGGVFFFFIGLLFVSKPAPKLKIDVWLTAVHVRHILRRNRKRVLRRIIEREHAIPENGVNDDVQIQCHALLDENKIEAMIECRRAAIRVHAAALAAIAVDASTDGLGAAIVMTLEHAAVNVGEQAEDRATGAIADFLGTPDVGGSLETDGMRRNSLVLDGVGAGARAVVGDASCATACARSIVVSARGDVTNFTSQIISSGQLKILISNLQINASLTVVFAIPWPPIHTQFINILSIFKLDLFKGLAVVVPCLYSTHYMSLAGFVTAPLIIVAVFVLAFFVVMLARIVIKRQSQSVRRAAKKLRCCRYTFESAGTATIKLAVLVILFLYPTICSKVFMTFKCVRVGGKSFLVADMSKACFEGDWIFAATIAAAAIAVYVVGIPLLLLVLLFVGEQRGTLVFPEIAFAQHTEIEPEEVMSAARRVNEFFRNRVAYGSLYDQVCFVFLSSSFIGVHCCILTPFRFPSLLIQYEPKYWWFEFCCTMRKMFLTGALVLFGAGTTPQVVTALAVCILWFGLIANLNPFSDAVDDRLAQVESIQVLFTLLIGLVLQLQALSPEGNNGDEEAIGIVLITLNLAVIALAFVQQPIVLKIANHLSSYARSIILSMRAHRDWKAAWLLKGIAEEEEEKENDDGATWVDVSSSATPRILDTTPIPLELCDEGEVCIGRDGKVIVNALTKFEAEDGRVLWIDTDASINYSEEPRYFDEVQSLDRATHWLDVGEQQLLLVQPMRLVLSEPSEFNNDGREEECANVTQVWHHRRSGVLTNNDPAAWRGPCARKIDARQPDKIKVNVKDKDDVGAREANPMQQPRTLGAAERIRGAAAVGDPEHQLYAPEVGVGDGSDASASAAIHPRGWIEKLSRSQNMPYYTNAHTGEMVWEKPTLAAPPAGWTVHAHAKNGQYFHNTTTGATLWEHPHDVVHPRGWTESHHATHNMPYYTNEHTGEMIWEKPTLPAPPAGWKVDDDDDGNVYFTNLETNAVQWKHPFDTVEVGVQEPPPATAQPPVAGAEESESLSSNSESSDSTEATAPRERRYV